MQIRTVTREHVSEYWKQSRVQSKDLGEVMDRAGVLLTPERLATIRAILLEQVAQELENTPTHQIIRGRALDKMTIPDFQAVLASWCRENAALERIKK